MNSFQNDQAKQKLLSEIDILAKDIVGASENLHGLRSLVDGTSDAVANVASASAEMDSSIESISQQAQNTTDLVRGTSEQVELTVESFSVLQERADKIVDVLKIIRGIASQTKMLALNATIEAARAGEAGKGFAVVANEVKQLSSQTESATNTISELIDDIHKSVGEASDGLSNVRDEVSSIDQASTEIAAAVSEQSVTSQEISHSLGRASDGVQGFQGAVEAIIDGVIRDKNRSSEIYDLSRKI